MKKTMMVLLAVLLIFCMTGCGKEEGKLTLDVVRSMAEEKGEALTWSDFEQYPSTETGSGLYILEYSIDDDYKLMIGGVPDEEPMYIYLVDTDDTEQRIDIRYDDIEAFLSKTK